MRQLSRNTPALQWALRHSVRRVAVGPENFQWENVLTEIARSSYDGETPSGPFWFGDSASMSDELNHLVLAHKKTATASLLWDWEHDADPLPPVGCLEALISWSSEFKGIVRTTAIDVVPFESVSSDFAALEGEGDLSLEYWRKVHWNYFSNVCQRIGRQPSMDMPVVCQKFALIYPTRDA